MKPTVSDVGAHIAQLLPHNQRRGREIFFLTSKNLILELSPEEVLLYDSVDGRRTVDDLEKMHPGTGDRLLKWHNGRILELIPPITPPATPHLVVIEPHMDDAASVSEVFCSIGGGDAESQFYRWSRGPTSLRT